MRVSKNTAKGVISHRTIDDTLTHKHINKNSVKSTQRRVQQIESIRKSIWLIKTHVQTNKQNLFSF